MGWFPFAKNREAAGASGSLICNPKHYKTGADSVLIYLSS